MYLTPVCPPCLSPQLVGVEARLGELEASHKELTDYKYRSQAAIRELKAKLKSTEEVSFMIQALYVASVAQLVKVPGICTSRPESSYVRNFGFMLCNIQAF